MKENPSKASIDDVASLAGVSTATVSRTFSKPEMVSSKTRQRVQKAADQLGFYVSRTAAVLKSGRTHRIAFLFGGAEIDWFTAKIIEGLNAALRDAGYDLVVYPLGRSETPKDFIGNTPLRGNADALIVSSLLVERGQCERLNEAGLPIVGINSASPGMNASVAIDDTRATATALRYLTNLGHTDICYVYEHFRSDHLFSSYERINTFREFCSLNPHINGRLIRLTPGTDSRGDVIASMLAMDPRPTALLFHQDSLAIPFFFTMQQTGLSIPQDISVMGFDDSEFSDAVGLTTTRQEPAAMACLAARKTIALIEKGAVDDPHETADTQLVIRDSVIRHAG